LGYNSTIVGLVMLLGVLIYDINNGFDSLGWVFLLIGVGEL
jgi:hypothetical protein